MLAPEGQYYNYSGCGNTLNCNHPVVRKFVLDALRYWVVEMHVDGFRFDLGSIMTRAHSLWHPSLPGDDPALTPQGTPISFWPQFLASNLFDLSHVSVYSELDNGAPLSAMCSASMHFGLS